jgi:hypothetical protein
LGNKKSLREKEESNGKGKIRFFGKDMTDEQMWEAIKKMARSAELKQRTHISLRRQKNLGGR